MKPITIKKAREAYTRAQAAVDHFRAAETRDQMFEAWETFLFQSHAVFARLEAGCKNNTKDQPWFGRKKNERKRDELLSYIHHARNSEHYGIGESLNHGYRMGVVGAIKFSGGTDEQGKFYVSELIPGTPGSALVVRETLELITVHDKRFGHSFHPPTMHLGVSIEPCSPLDAAILTLKYLDALIIEAENRV